MKKIWHRFKCSIGFHRFVHENVMASMNYPSDIEVCTRCFYERVIRGPM